MGNSPSKSNAAPTSSNNTVGGLNSSASTSSTLNPSSEPEPDDRKFPSSTNHHHIHSQKVTSLKPGTNYGLKYKHKLQKRIPSNIDRHFNYTECGRNGDFNTTDGTPDEKSSQLAAADLFDLEINLSMAEALLATNNVLSSSIPNTKAMSSSFPNSTNNAVTDAEVSSSFSDLFTVGSSTSSSYSISPNFNCCLPPIVEEPKKSVSTASTELLIATKVDKPARKKNRFDIDSVIDRLLNTNNPNYSNNNSPVLHGRGSFNYGPHDFPISSKEIAVICSQAREVFLHQPSLLKLKAPVKVVGDIHGQFNDLLRILRLSGLPPHSNYLFLGDYVDRGKQSLETILLMLCFKIKYPENFFMLRGNHESASVCKIYGFYDECKRRLNVKAWKLFVDVFNSLPIAAIINNKIFCVHGGLSPSLSSLDQIEAIQRPTDIPESGLLADLLWSDPDLSTVDWAESDRGVSFTFGKKIVESFNRKFKFDLIIRGHMVVEDGYEFFAKKKLVTVFSAPNYCGEFNNWGAVMSVEDGLMCSFELLKPNKKLQH